MKKKRVIVAMSGGVDSSVAALLLKKQGYDVIGMTLRLWSSDEDSEVGEVHNKRCCSVEDVEDARNVCDVLDIPHYFVNFEKEFQEHVVNYFVREYDSGRTPHPCLACNDKIKFDFLLRRAMFLEADYIATGHYARLDKSSSGVKLMRGIDSGKDQSYVLFTLNQPELQKLLFPVGEYTKKAIRDLAVEGGLPVADKPDSQEICFIPSGNYREFLQERIKARPGSFVDTSGNLLGDHPGIQFFTVGQRRRLGLKQNGLEPKFVLKIDNQTNEITLGDENELYRKRFSFKNLSLTHESYKTQVMNVFARIRYKAEEAQATAFFEGDSGVVEFKEAQRAITPGQPVGFYDGEELLGGRIIETVLDDTSILEQPKIFTNV